MLLRKPRSYAEVYNDQWKVVVDVFRCMRDPATAAELDRRLRLTPYSRDEFFDTYITEADDIVERVRKTITRSFMGFGSASTNGEYVTGFRGKSNASGRPPAMDWINYPDCIRTFTERLYGVVIENLDAVEIIERNDAPDALIYCDPPYPHDTRNMARGNASYAHEFADADHERLAVCLRACRGMVLVSTYPNALYDSLYPGWEVRERDALADGAQPRREVLYINPACAALQRQTQLPMEHRT